MSVLGHAVRVHVGLFDGDAATAFSESRNADLQPVADGE